MRARYARGARVVASAAITWVMLKLEDLGLILVRFAAGRRQRRYDIRAVDPRPIAATLAVPGPTNGQSAHPDLGFESVAAQEARAQNEGMPPGGDGGG